MTLRLGVIGISEGNGHPYSWSAIFNGYDQDAMETCGFPVIPRYLRQQSWPEATIKGADVTAVWTQDPVISRRIAKAARIPTVCRHLEDLIRHVDAVLLARDDAENHWRYAEPFLAAGLPIYIDKPIALYRADLKRFYEKEKYTGQIFTCSAMRYSQELTLTSANQESLGEIVEITAYTPNSWEKYGIHLIEPALKLLPIADQMSSCCTTGVCTASGGTSTLLVRWKSGINTVFHATGRAASPLILRVHGTRGWKDLVFTDSFSAFRAALKDFVEGVETKTARSPRDFNERVVQLVEAGLK